MMSFEKEILTLTFPLNVLIGHQKEIMTLTFTLNVMISHHLILQWLIGQLNSHMIESFANIEIKQH